MEQLKRILLIDDDPVSNFLTQAIIENTFDSNVKIDLAENGLVALEIVKEYCLEKNLQIYIFCDINMPAMDGFQFLDECRKISKNMTYKVIILTSSSAKKDLNMAAQLNVDAYINKPLTTDKLREALRLSVG